MPQIWIKQTRESIVVQSSLITNKVSGFSSFSNSDKLEVTLPPGHRMVAGSNYVIRIFNEDDTEITSSFKELYLGTTQGFRSNEAEVLQRLFIIRHDNKSHGKIFVYVYVNPTRSGFKLDPNDARFQDLKDRHRRNTIEKIILPTPSREAERLSTLFGFISPDESVLLLRSAGFILPEEEE